MTKFEIMDSLIEQQGGYLLSAEAQQAGISRTYISGYVKENKLEQVAAGIYILPEIWPDSLFILQLKNRGVVFSHETALYLHGLMEREPASVRVTVKRGYNATHLINRGIKPCYVTQDLFDEGVTSAKTVYGNRVRVYDINRTICDIVLRKDEMDIQIFQTAMKEYMAGEEKNIHNLMKYAKLLGVEKKMREYTEILL